MDGPSRRSQPGPTLPSHLEGRALLVLRTAWVVSASGLVALTAVAVVRTMSDPELVAPAPVAELFATFGLNLRLVAVALAMSLVVVVGICVVVFWRRSHDPMALLFTMTLLLFYTFGSRVLLAYSGVPILRHAGSLVFALMFVALAFVLALFPNGRFVPRASRWLVAATVAMILLFPDAFNLAEPVIQGEAVLSARAAIMLSASLAIIAVGLLAQVYRYRHISGLEERQQTKWVMGPLGMLMVVASVPFVLPAAFPGAHERWVGWALLLSLSIMLVVPIGVANAVLRYRLYEIDRIISRTVSYALLTALLVGVYAAGVVGMGGVVRAFDGAGSGDLVVAASTLAVAAAFGPLRRRIQGLVDRQFNRARYDAHRTVETFTQRLRHEVDLATVTSDLAQVAASTLHPAYASVWLSQGSNVGTMTHTSG